MHILLMKLICDDLQFSQKCYCRSPFARVRTAIDVQYFT